MTAPEETYDRIMASRTFLKNLLEATAKGLAEQRAEAPQTTPWDPQHDKAVALMISIVCNDAIQRTVESEHIAHGIRDSKDTVMNEDAMRSYL